MKKLFIGAITGVAALSLVACSESAEPIEGTKDSSSLTLEEVFKKSLERQESLESVKAEADMQQNSIMKFEGEEFTMSMSSNLEMSMTLDPLALFMDGTISMTMLEDEEEMEMPLQMYFTEADGIFMNDMTSEGGWVKFPNEMYEELLAQAGASADATEQLKILEPYLSDFKFEQNDTSYVLTLNAQGEKFNDLIYDLGKDALNQATLSEEDAAMLENIKFSNAKFIITVDKKTFDTTKVSMNFDMAINIEGIESTVTTATTINYSDFNNVAPIKVPQDVIDNAVDGSF